MFNFLKKFSKVKNEVSDSFAKPKTELKSNKSNKINAIHLRCEPARLSDMDWTRMIMNNGFYNVYEKKEGRGGNGIIHHYELKNIQGEDVIVDKVTKLMWQKTGSLDSLTYHKALDYLQRLNETKFAGSMIGDYLRWKKGIALWNPPGKMENFTLTSYLVRLRNIFGLVINLILVMRDLVFTLMRPIIY